jgi:hypothetical protein
MRLLVCIACSLPIALGQSVSEKTVDNPPPDPAPAKEAGAPTDPDKPDPKKRARELLDKAYETAGAARPEVQVAALLHLADSYSKYDFKKAKKCLEEAFVIAPTVPADKGMVSWISAEVVSFMAGVDVEAAIAMIPQLSPQTLDADVRVEPTQTIVRKLLADKKLDRAIAAVEIAGW